MVTGDQYAIAVETSRRLGLGTHIMEGDELLSSKASNMEFAKHVEAMDGFAGVFPEHKHRIVEAVQMSGRLVGMTGKQEVHCIEAQGSNPAGSFCAFAFTRPWFVESSALALHAVVHAVVQQKRQKSKHSTGKNQCSDFYSCFC